MKGLQLLLLSLALLQVVLGAPAYESANAKENAMIFQQDLRLYNGTHFINATYEDRSFPSDFSSSAVLLKRGETSDYRQDCKSHLSIGCHVILPRGNCYRSIERIPKTDEYISGTCYRGCGTFVKGPPHCRFTGKEMKEIFMSMHDEMTGCKKCMWRKYADGCEFKADYVLGCNGPLEIYDPKNMKSDS
jgi:hypothetical protein